MSGPESRHLDASCEPVPGLMINCIDLVELVTGYLEGDLDEATTREFEAHLALCDACRTYIDQMRGTINALGRVPVESLTEQAKAELLSAFKTFRRSGPGLG